MLIAYLRERVPLRVYAPLALALGACADLRDPWLPALAASALLLQFRLWDDLADRAHDAVAHPTRVLVRAADVRPLIALCLALAVLNVCVAVWRDATGVAVSVLAATDAALATWYLARRERTAFGDHLLLAKYPAMLIVVAGERVVAAPVPILVSAAVLYLAACLYEAWHDRSSPLARYLSIGGH